MGQKGLKSKVLWLELGFQALLWDLFGDPRVGPSGALFLSRAAPSPLHLGLLGG